MSLNLPDSVDSELAANKTNKDGSDVTSPAGWPFVEKSAPLGSKALGTLTAGKNLAGGVFVDGNQTTSYITFPLGQVIGQGEFSLWVRLSVPSGSSFGNRHKLLTLGAAANGDITAGSIDLFLESDGRLECRIRGDNVSNTLDTGIGGFIANFGGEIVDLVLTRSGTTLKIYINGMDTVLTGGGSTGTPPTIDQSINSLYCHIGYIDSTPSGMILRVLRAGVFNYALSQARVDDLIKRGVGATERFGSVTPIISPTVLNGGFETLGGGGADVFANWSENVLNASTLVAETTEIRSGLQSARMDVDASNSTVSLTAAGVMVPGRYYRVEFWAKANDATGNPQLRIDNGSVVRVAGPFTLTTNWQKFTADFVARASGLLLVRDNGSAGTASKSLYIDDVTLLPLGALVLPDLTPGIGRFFPDNSANKAHGESTGSGIGHLLPRTSGDLTVTKTLLHSEISATAATTLLLALPPNCGLADIEIDRDTAFDGGITVDVGVTGTPAKFASAANVATTGKLFIDSLSKGSEHASNEVSVWIKKSGATTLGKITVRARYVIRGGA